MRARLAPPLALAALALTLAGSARADEAPDPGPCDFRKLGDACEDAGKTGTCVANTCSRLSYANGSPPESVDYDCLRCDLSAAAKETAKPEVAAPAEPTPTSAPPPAATGSCAVDPGLARSGLGGAGLLVVLGLGYGLGRRRRG